MSDAIRMAKIVWTRVHAIFIATRALKVARSSRDRRAIVTHSAPNWSSFIAESTTFLFNFIKTVFDRESTAQSNARSWPDRAAIGALFEAKSWLIQGQSGSYDSTRHTRNNSLYEDLFDTSVHSIAPSEASIDSMPVPATQERGEPMDAPLPTEGVRRRLSNYARPVVQPCQLVDNHTFNKYYEGIYYNLAPIILTYNISQVLSSVVLKQ